MAFFKKAQAGQIKTDLQDDDEVKEVLPDLPAAGARNFVSHSCFVFLRLKVDLRSLVDRNQTTCLNEAPKHEWENILDEGNNNWLESDCDEQLLLNVRFDSACQIHSLVLHSGDLCMSMQQHR